MKKVLTLAALLALSLNVMAEDKGGFEAGETPPPPHKQDAGYKGSEDTNESLIKTVHTLKADSWVTLEGNITKKIAGNTYAFQDKSGKINLVIPESAWGGKKYDAKDLVRVSGFVKHRGKQTEIAVKQIGDP
ncbi:YgiW/YdeI family stress tolerance OB fold protein [Kalamiella sp. sgz302252]|uniref:YgiW/YdeI family stress tolerance OB fold protein n=1 Tax=Pantoea sp. sgz302252 TaxID=3341827 RepID=UPI0036D2B646